MDAQHRNISTTLATLAALLVLVLVGASQGSAVAPRITEDSPAWNCHTMGNHRCGPAVMVTGGSTAAHSGNSAAPEATATR